MRRLFLRIHFFIETLFIRSPGYQLLAVILVLIALSVGGGLVVHLGSPQFPNLPQAVWWAFLRLTDPGYLGDDVGLVPRVVSTFLTLAGYVIMLGALIAIMTTWLDRLMAFLASGRSPVFARDHIVIIGWNSRLHALVEELVHTDQRFNDRKPTIVIMAEQFEPRLLSQLKAKLDPQVRNKCRLVVRSGNALEAESLDRIDFANARAVILLARPAQRHLSDVTLAKILMSMHNRIPNAERPPNVVVEVADPADKLLVESVGWRETTEAVAGQEILGRLFCQTVRFPGISAVYTHLLTDTYGDSVTLVAPAKLDWVGCTIREMALNSRMGVPIGRLHPVDGLRLLDLDTPLTDQDEVVVVGAGRDGQSSDPDVEGSPVLDSAWSGPQGRCILIVGWSSHVPALLGELARYHHERFQVTVLSSQPPDWLPSFANVEVTVREGKLQTPGEVDRLELERFDSILLLASELAGDPLVADAQTIMRFVLLDRALGQRRVNLAVELNDEDNRPLLAARECDVIMTAEIVSHLLAQVAVRRELVWIYEELFTAGGGETRLYPLTSLVPGGTSEVSFSDCQKASLARGAVAIGYRLATGIHLNPPSEVRLQLAPGDQLILVELENDLSR